MGKQGPCYHCGITTTPLWRNGPPEKPVLCNACGSRWRTKGTLLNYMPMHSGGFGVGNDPDKWPRSMKNSFAKLSRKRKEPSDGTTSDSALSKAGVYFSTPSVEEETSTRSSLGSEVSTFDGPVNSSLGTARASPWDTPVPSRKRTNMFRSRASSERLSRSLISMEEQEVSSITYPSSDTILVETKSPLVAVEIGLGSVFIRQPTPRATQEPESEATSSLLIDSHKSATFGEVENSSNKSLAGPSRGKEKVKPSPSFMHPVKPSKALLERFPYNKRDFLQSSQSPLVFLDLKDVVNFDTFTGLLTEQEQLQLTKQLSSVDVAHCPESLKNMFSSGQFEVAISNFQQLLSAGMFDLTELGPNPRVHQHFQQLLSVTDLTSSGWMDRCSQLQQARSTRRRSELEKYKGNNDNAGEQQQQNKLERAGLFSKPLAPPPPLPRQTPLQRDVSKTKHVFAEPRAVVENASARTPSTRQQQQVKPLAAQRGEVKPQQRSIMEEGHDSGGELDLLVEVPPSMSFHQAEELAGELLLVNRGPASVATTRDVAVQEQREEEQEEDAHEGDLIMSNTWHTSDWDGGLIWTPSTSSASKGIVLPNGTVLNP